ncbi:MAG: NapC/NirT family cytochrome c [Gammaproteobacteria bacterium]|nr:NapC/NirT family cytochrome c [Gammaproteobacteria bacterium]
MSTSVNSLRKLLNRKVIMGATAGAALFFMLMGVIFWGGFNTAMEATNTLDFCISCHEMENNVYQEYKKTIHFANRSGVRATCSDCHVPRDWTHKVIRKIQASGEVFHKVMGSVDTPEKFDNKRLTLAKRVWNTMKSTDSRECRNCHDFGSMDPADQKPRARKQHFNAMKSGQTCIDCHKGIAHTKVSDRLTDQDAEQLEKPNPSLIKPIPVQWQAFFDGNGDSASDAEPAAAATPQESAAEDEPSPAASPAPAPAPVTSTGAGVDSGIDWAKAPTTEITIFYPGQASMEWVLNGRDHGGARPLNAGDRCFDCHGEEAADMGEKIVSGEKLEPQPIVGKRGSIAVAVQATHDNDYLYMRFLWDDTPHVAVPFVESGKMDAQNPSKLAMMLASDDIEYADRSGCWITCHNDMKGMPDAPPAEVLAGNAHAKELNWASGVTKYLPESRTEMEIKGGSDKPRGGWDKLKESSEIQSELEAGHYLDLVRYKIGEGLSENGHVLDSRHMDGGEGAEFSGGLSNGQWAVVMRRKLSTEQPGDISLATDQLYNLGFAIHDDHSAGRFHHVSLGYKLGFDNDEAEINAVKQ